MPKPVPLRAAHHCISWTLGSKSIILQQVQGFLGNDFTAQIWISRKEDTKGTPPRCWTRGLICSLLVCALTLRIQHRLLFPKLVGAHGCPWCPAVVSDARFDVMLRVAQHRGLAVLGAPCMPLHCAPTFTMSNGKGYHSICSWMAPWAKSDMMRL